MLTPLMGTAGQGYYRRASANFQLGKFRGALKDYEAVCKVRPNDKDAVVKFKECKKLVTRLAFEKVRVQSQQPLWFLGWLFLRLRVSCFFLSLRVSSVKLQRRCARICSGDFG